MIHRCGRAVGFFVKVLAQAFVLEIEKSSSQKYVFVLRESLRIPILEMALTVTELVRGTLRDALGFGENAE